MAWPTSTHRVGSQVKRSVQAAIGREGGARRIDAKPPKNRRYRGRADGLSATALAFTVLALAMTAPAARAAKSVSDAFGAPGNEGSAFGTPQGIAVNSTGAGGFPAGTTYVVDSTQNRVQRFGPSHDFVSAWGFDVTLPVASPDFSAEFEVCTVAVECKAGVSTISPAPGGELSFGAGGGGGVAVNQTTGDVYVTNANFLRVDEFSATGSFIRAFGKDVVQSGHLGDTGTDFEICSVAADCKSGEGGSGAGAFLDLNASYLAIAPATAPNACDVFVSDRGNRRVSEYTATGAFVRSFGWDVVEAGPDNTAGGEFEVCNAGVDTCHIGAPGSGAASLATSRPPVSPRTRPEPSIRSTLDLRTSASRSSPSLATLSLRKESSPGQLSLPPPKALRPPTSRSTVRTTSSSPRASPQEPRRAASTPTPLRSPTTVECWNSVLPEPCSAQAWPVSATDCLEASPSTRPAATTSPRRAARPLSTSSATSPRPQRRSNP